MNIADEIKEIMDRDAMYKEIAQTYIVLEEVDSDYFLVRNFCKMYDMSRFNDFLNQEKIDMDYIFLSVSSGSIKRKVNIFQVKNSYYGDALNFDYITPNLSQLVISIGKKANLLEYLMWLQIKEKLLELILKFLKSPLFSQGRAMIDEKLENWKSFIFLQKVDKKE